MVGEQISEYNGALLQVQRLHNVWISLRYFREQGDMVRVRFILDSAELELTNDLIRVDRDKDKKIGPQLEAVNQNIFNTVVPSRLYPLLKLKEGILRMIEEAAGKGSKFRDPDEEDF